MFLTEAATTTTEMTVNAQLSELQINDENRKAITAKKKKRKWRRLQKKIHILGRIIIAYFSQEGFISLDFIPNSIEVKRICMHNELELNGGQKYEENQDEEEEMCGSILTQIHRLFNSLRKIFSNNFYDE